MACSISPKIWFRCGILWFLLIVIIKSEDSENSLTACEVEKLLKPLLSPPYDNTIQAQALRQELINLIRQGLDEQDDEAEEKRSISTLARWNNLPLKRNLQALARDGYLRTSLDNDGLDTNDPNLKRSNHYLTRKGDIVEIQNDEAKRSISSLARNGELYNSRRELEELLDELLEKRNIGSVARDFNFPTYGKRFLGSLARTGDLSGRYLPGKRNIASIVRNGKRSFSSLVRNNNLPENFDEHKRNIASLAREGGRFVGKRNVAALLRQDNFLNEHQHDPEYETQTQKPEHDSEDAGDQSKRNLASIKAGYKYKYKRSVPYNNVFSIKRTRSKRDVDYYDVLNEEYPQPVFQNQNSVDYEELLHALTGVYPNTEKRFLGSVARSGWPSALIKYRSIDKRHIGSLARLGWLPAFRSVRRFNRSGRSTAEECRVCRETSADGETENNPFSEISDGGKQLLLIPTIDKSRLRRFPMGPRNI